jgi:lipid-A-disaccharide synthase
MTYYIIAGERSGDLHGGNLIRAIRTHDAAAQVRCWGGEQMEAAGATLVRHYRDLAFMGFWEVAKNLGTIRRLMRECQADVLAHRPNALILIDYAGFNLRMAKWAKRQGIRVYYYISPKVWAWNQRRALAIKANVDKLFVILPFERTFFGKYGYEVEYVGNPLLDALSQHQTDPDFLAKIGNPTRPVIALLPGSRVQEVKAMLPVMYDVASHFPEYEFVVGTVSNLPEELYYESMAGSLTLRMIEDSAYDLLKHATAALVTSGTATLETALLNVPQVVCYKTSWLSYEIARRLIAVPYISLVNLIVDRPLVTELIQADFTPERTYAELRAILPGSPKRTDVLTGYADLQQRMGNPGASERVGNAIVEDVKAVGSV